MGVLLTCKTCDSSNSVINNNNYDLKIVSCQPTKIPYPLTDCSSEVYSKIPKLNLITTNTQSISIIKQTRTSSYLTSTLHGDKSCLSTFSIQHTKTESTFDVQKSMLYPKHINNALSKYEKKQLFQYLSEHFLFRNIITKSNFISFVKDKVLKEFHERQEIFKEGKSTNEHNNEAYIILSGEVELKSNDTDKVIRITKFTLFGDVAIVEKEFKRKYNATALCNNTMLLCFNKKQYQEFLTKHKDKDSPSITNHEEAEELISKIKLFSYLDENTRKAISNFVYPINLLYTNNQVTLNETFYLIKQGKVDCNPFCTSFHFEMTSNMFYGINDFLLNNKTLPLNVFPNEDTLIYLIPKSTSVEILGTNAQYHMIFPYFKSLFLKNKTFSKVFNEAQLISIYKLFTMNQYFYNTTVFSNKDKAKLFIILDGELECHRRKENKDHTTFKSGKLYGDDILTRNTEFDNDVKSKYNTILLECDLDLIMEKIKEYRNDIVRKMNSLKSIKYFEHFNEYLLLEITTNMEEFTYYKGDSISVFYNKIDCCCFIKDGKVALLKKKIEIGTFNKGDIIESKHNGEIIAMTEVVMISVIHNKYFHMNDNEIQVIKNVEFENLYYIDDLSCNVLLLHNKQIFLIAKVLYKLKHNLHKVSRELACSLSKNINHPLMIKSISFLETNKHFILLYKYIQGSLNITRFIKEIPPNNEEHNTKLFIFIALCLFTIIDYLHSKKILHRNITTENILIDKSNGYCKLKDFSLSKDLRNKNSNKTISCIPKFSAPELINGENHSFAADYWSIGICLYYVYYKKYPFDNEDSNNAENIYREMMCKKLTYLKTPFEIKELLSGLLCKDQNMRISNLEQIKKLKLFEGINFDEVASQRMESPLKEIISQFKNETYEMSLYSPLKKYLNQYKKALGLDIDEGNWSKNF